MQTASSLHNQESPQWLKSTDSMVCIDTPDLSGDKIRLQGNKRYLDSVISKSTTNTQRHLDDLNLGLEMIFKNYGDMATVKESQKRNDAPKNPEDTPEQKACKYHQVTSLLRAYN